MFKFLKLSYANSTHNLIKVLQKQTKYRKLWFAALLNMQSSSFWDPLINAVPNSISVHIIWSSSLTLLICYSSQHKPSVWAQWRFDLVHQWTTIITVTISIMFVYTYQIIICRLTQQKTSQIQKHQLSALCMANYKLKTSSSKNQALYNLNYYCYC